MSDTARWIQSAALVVVGAAAVPLAVNEWARWGERRALEQRAERYAAIAREALEAGDTALAGQALADALEAAPADPARRRALVEAHVEQILADPTIITGANALRLEAELRTVVSGKERPSPRALVALGKVLQFRGRDDEARRHFTRAIELAPDLAVAHMHLGDHLFKAKEHEAAAAALEKALSLDPDLHPARFALGQTRLAQEKYKEAEALLAEAAAKLDRAYVHLALGRARLRLEQWDEAVAALERAATLDPGLDAVHAPLGEAYAGKGQLELAAGAFQTAYRRNGDIEAYRRLGEVLQRLGRHREAVTVFGDLGRLQPADPRHPLALARSAEALGEANLARGALDTAIRLAGADKRHAAVLDEARRRRAALQAGGDGQTAR